MIVVTGAFGFIGSNIVAELNDRGENDIAICDWVRDDGRWKNLSKAIFTEQLFPEELFDFLDRAKPQAVIHMGANSSTTSTDGDDVFRTNLRYTMKLIDRCAALGIPLIYASSAATYGDGDLGYVDDSSFQALRKLRPLNLYGWSKSQVDLIVAWRKERDLPLPPRCIGLKFFNVYGPNEYHKGSMMSVVAKCHSVIRSGKPVQLFKSHKAGYADGEQKRDFIHIDDVVKVTLWFLNNGPAHGVFNCGTGEAATFRRFVEALYTAMGVEPDIQYIPMPEELRDRYQYFTEASMLNLRNAGYREPFLSVEDGVRRYERYLSSEDRYR
jgi:ADP-L-glycero-D-manno-heptose 6-epimerase